ncbi:MAG: AMP-binding protein [Actinobacteria bacterium]|nr:AMP-binding protein [Actinomycetota bacterium]
MISSEGWGMKKGDRALLVYPPSLDFIITFIACLRAGIVAVPVFPPDPRQLQKNLHLFASVQRSSGATVCYF